LPEVGRRAKAKNDVPHLAVPQLSILLQSSSCETMHGREAQDMRKSGIAIAVIAVFGGIALASIMLATAARAQPFPIPGKPIRIIVPTAVGGGLDVQARAIGQKMAISLGVPVFVDNRPGAGTMIGIREAKRSAPDGHTLLYTISTIAQLPMMSRAAQWNAFTDFTPITAGVKASVVLTAHVSAPFQNVAELVAYAKVNPGKLSYASFGAGSGSHLYGELFKRLAGIDIVHVPYKGAGEAMKDQIAGSVILSFDSPTVATANVRSGYVKYIATVGDERNAAFPDVPTMREQGYDVGRTSYNWFFGPAGMAPETVDAVYSHLKRAIADPDVQKLFAANGTEPSGIPPAEMAVAFREIADYWGKVIRDLGIRID
jgi:tripartite-type tricarboxylate transporter receptor subunit TctC